MTEKLQGALDAFMEMCDTLNLTYHIAFRYKKWKTNICHCTVTVGGKQFSAADEKDAMHNALKLAIEYMLKTYAVFAKQNEQYINSK